MKDFKKVIIIGLGVSGRSALRLMSSLDKEIVIVNKGGVEHIESLIQADLGKEFKKYEIVSDQEGATLEHHHDADFVILSPGIPRDHTLLNNIDIPIYNEIEVASWYIDEPVIAITGTNGKTTTVSFLSECFKHSQYTCFTGGNIGQGLCDYVLSKNRDRSKKCDYILLELSSFQLESIKSFHSKVSAILNITFSHGERYESLSDYALAKGEIFKNTEFGIFPKGLWESLKLRCPYNFTFQILDLSDSESIKNELNDIKESLVDRLHIHGIHNLYNLYFAKKILEYLKIDLDCFIKACDSFKGVEYRFQYLGKYNNVHIYNDAKSTNWQATETALNAVNSESRIYSIIGGSLRGENDFSKDFFKQYKDKVATFILTGESGHYIRERLEESDLLANYIYLETLDEIKRYIDEEVEDGVVVYSPAFPSFDQFNNYIDRGSSFTRIFT